MPNDTVILRATIQLMKRYMYYAKVIGDEIIFGGKPVSPAMMVMEITKSRRNSWTELWVHRPSDKNWILADRLRRSGASTWKGSSEDQTRCTENARGHRELADQANEQNANAPELRLPKRRSRIK